MNNFDLYKLLNFVVNKDVYAKAISPDEFNLELKAKNIRHLRKRIGLPETYIPGSANEGVGVTRINDRDLLPFLVEAEYSIEDNIVTLPDGWYYILDWWTDRSISSDLIGYEEVSNRLKNYLLRPTEYHPIAYIVPLGLKVFPQWVCNVSVLHYRTPATPEFSVLTDDDTLNLVYDEAGSVELEWDDGNKLDILHMILQDMGMNLERGDLLQMGAKLIQQGK